MLKGIKVLSMCVTAIILSFISRFIWDRRTNRIYFKSRKNQKNIGDRYGT